jgi:DNA invertase Pin-like site-specific DNA recombinase
MKKAIGYLRVSTREQGRSGLGLAAQRHDIETFGEREGFEVKSWYQDIQTGAGKDALLLRPGLAAALKEARTSRSSLIVSRLDRLSRNVHFISGLMEHKVHLWSRPLVEIVTPSRCISTPRLPSKSAR